MHFFKSHSPVLNIRVGALAKQHLLQHGLNAGDIDIIPGAAGGPKGLGLQGLDRAVFDEFLPRSPRRRTLIGSSIGSWRFASILAWGATQGTARLAELYSQMQFHKKMQITDISAISANMLDALLENQANHIVQHPDYQLVILAVKARHLFQHDHKVPLMLSLAGIMASNAISRKHNQWFMQRVIVQPSHENPFQLPQNPDFPTLYQPLNSENLKAWLMASGSIPAVMSAVTQIEHATQGSYRDGGLVDYHLDLPYPSQGIVLYPHFTHKIIPGWFDKTLFWRKSNPKFQARTLLISPSPAYLQKLPLKRLPDRKDFVTFAEQPQKRMQIWQQCIDESQRLGDAFLELVEKQNWQDYMQDLK